jgi:protein-ribulosamine 3-kinase
LTSLFAELGIVGAQPVSGGCIHRCYRASRAGRAVFLKVNDARLADAFAAEADGLAALRAAGCTAPEPLSHGMAGAQSYLMMEFLELESRGDFAALGRMLAAMHGAHGAEFGWTRGNYIGSTPQQNARHKRWARFWREERLEPQVALARGNGYAIDIGDVCDLLDGHDPAPSLLHGDLWGGNAGFLRSGAPVVFDPAVYYGDREADLAMTELFGGFPPEFYSAYGKLPAGYEMRKHLYNLYHLLNHLNLFGGGYLGQVKATLGLLARAL